MTSDRPQAPNDEGAPAGPPPEPPAAEERPALDPLRIAGEVREGVEHVVEEVREEVEELHDRIEDVVEEHLPRPVRWGAGRIAWLILGSVVVLTGMLVAAAFLYVTRNSVWAAGELTRVINQTLAQHSNLVLEVHDLEGNPLKQVRLIRPRLRFRSGTAPAILEAPSMTVAYTPWSLWLGRRRSIEITLDRPVMRLTRGKDGRLLLPVWTSEPAAAGAGRELEVLFHLRGGTVRLPDSTLDIENWSFDAQAIIGQGSRVQLQRMSWDRGPYESRLAALDGEVTTGDSLRFRVGELRTGDLALRASGAWKAGRPSGAAGTVRVVHVEVGRVRWKWLARVFDNGVFDVPGEGRGVIDARGDREWRGHVTADAVWDSVAMQGSGEFGYAQKRLRLDPLTLSSAIGLLGGRLSYDANDWELVGDVRHGDPARWGIIGLRGWPSGNLNGRMTYRNHRQGDKHASHLDAALLASDLGGWRADSATTVIDFPVSGPDTFAVRMMRRGGTFLLLGRVGAKGWLGRYELARYPLDEWEDGRKSGLSGLLTGGRGTVEGGDDGLQVAGTLEGTSSDWLGIHTAHWRLDDLHGRLLPTPDLAMAASLRDFQFLGLHFDSAGVGLRLGDRRAELERIAAQAGDTLVRAAGRSDWDEHGWRLSFGRASAESRQFSWTADPPLELAGDPKGVDFERFEARDSLAHVTLSGRWAAPGGRYDWTGHGEKLDLGRLGMPAEWGLSGTTDVEVRVEGASGDPRWHVEASATAPGARGHRLEDLSLSAEGRPSEVDVRRLVTHLDGGRLEARVHFEDAAKAWPETLTAGGLRAWLIESARWSGGADADSIAIEGLERLMPGARGWGGRLWGRLTVGGSPRQPEFGLSAEARPLRRDSLVTEAVTARATYRDGRLEVPELKVRRGSLLGTVTGEMPLTLSLTGPPEVPDQPMAWRVQVVNGDLAALPFLVPQVAQARGRIDGSARIEGTGRHPTLDGSAEVRDGVVAPAGREEVLEGIYANFRLSRSRISLDTLFARQGRRGEVTGHGAIELEGSALKGYRFDLGLREFTVIESGFYVAQINGRVAVTDGPRVNGQTLPQIGGEIELDKGVIVFDFANSAEQERLAATTQPLLWTYRIHLLANNNLRWQPPDGDIEFNADLTLEQTPGALGIYGEMHALRGTYHFLSNRFTVSNADLTFDNVGGVNPVLDASATTRIVPTQGPTEPVAGQTEDRQVPHQVTVHITGRSDRPVIEFATDPDDWDQARVLRELTVGRFFEGNNVALGDPVDNYLTRKLNEQLDPLLSKAFMGYVNQWTLAREQGGVFYGQGELYLKVSSQINPQLMVSYSQKLPGFARPYVASTANLQSAFERNLEAEYRLNRFFYVTTGYSQRRYIGASVTGTTLGQEFDVNLKARWEY